MNLVVIMQVATWSFLAVAFVALGMVKKAEAPSPGYRSAGEL